MVYIVLWLKLFGKISCQKLSTSQNASTSCRGAVFRLWLNKHVFYGQSVLMIL